MADPSDEGAVERLAKRVEVLEERLGAMLAKLVLLGAGFEQHAPSPDYRIVEPCSCEESLALRARVKSLEACIARLAGHS